MAKAQAYCTREVITAVKSFMIQATAITNTVSLKCKCVNYTKKGFATLTQETNIFDIVLLKQREPVIQNFFMKATNTAVL
jgi:hypothetical protein